MQLRSLVSSHWKFLASRARHRREMILRSGFRTTRVRRGCGSHVAEATRGKTFLLRLTWLVLQLLLGCCASSCTVCVER